MKFAQPVWLVLLVLLPLLGAGAVVAARLRRKQWAAFVAPRLRGVLVKHGGQLHRWTALLFLLAACAASVIALARPQGNAGTRTEKSLGRNLLIALDLSRSMRVRDVKPDRLAQAKMVIFELLDAMPNERVGLLGFAGNAYIYAPLTVDHAAVRETVDQIDESWVPLGGSDLAAAVHLATVTLKKTGQKNNALVILSDGEQHEGDLGLMIAEAQRAGVYVLAIGVGTEDGDYVPSADAPANRMEDRGGKPVISRLQPEVLRKLAAETKGRYALAGSGVDIPAMVQAAVRDLDAFEMEGRERSVSIEFYQWLVLPAIISLLGSILAGTCWRGVRAAVMVAGGLLVPLDARADALAAAQQALRQQHYPEARDAYHQLAERATLPERRARYSLGEAYAAYLGKDYQAARAAYSRALLCEDAAIRANSYVGMGNTLFQLGWQGLADESYPEDPARLPDLDRFATLVRERLAKLRESAVPEQGDASGYAGMEALITNWVDAVRHFDSALAANPANAPARNNRNLTMIYLKRLRELLDEDQKSSQEAMPQPQPGEGKPEPGAGEPKDKPEGDEGDAPGPKPPGDKGRGDKDPKKDGSANEQASPEDKSGPKPGAKDSAKGTPDPNETPEERARRILQENADLEKGPLTPGRREFRPATKDW